MTILHTARLTLEPITEQHYAELRKLNSDPAVMRFLNGGIPETEEGTLAMIARVKAAWAAWGYSWWALILTDGGQMVGAACLQHLGRDAAKPREIGWRLGCDCWGKGYASEAARAIVGHAFHVVGADEVCAVADPDNAASITVMRRLGMRYVGIETHYERPCATYRLERADWLAGVASPT
ncbi:MAG TPA: N-acetyltransferase [Janthinobacterium sp.]|nr:N-acetyltransferase [Janthinobacterium sp.]